MTKIDFYQLNPNDQRADRVVCHLCQKAYESNTMTLLLTQDQQQTDYMDRQLWIYSDDSFVPHDTDISDDFPTPILIRDTAPQDCERELLINLSNQIPENFAQYERIIELVTEDNKLEARRHYSYYRERGYPLNHRQI